MFTEEVVHKIYENYVSRCEEKEEKPISYDEFASEYLELWRC